MTSEQIEHNFSHHPPTGDQIVDLVDLRGHALTLAQQIQERCPEGREKSLALTKVEEAVMWANAAIVRAPGENQL